MAFIETISPADAKDDVRAMYERQQSSWGFVPNYAKVFCYRPEVMARWGRLLAEIKRPMDFRRFELVTFVAAHALRHTGCALGHGKALAAFVGEDAVRALALGTPCDRFSDAEMAIVAFTRKVATDASAIAVSDVDTLRAHGLPDEEIFDIVATAAGRAFFTKILDGLGVDAEACLFETNRELKEVLTIGRPIDSREPETMPV